MKDQTFMEWMGKHYPHLVRRVRRYGMMMAGMGFALGFYMGLFLPGFVQALPDIYKQLTHENVPLYTVYIMIFVVAFGAFYIGRKARKYPRRK